MKKRVTAIVTLFILILIGIFLYESCTVIAKDLDEIAGEELDVTCRSAGAALEGVSSALRAEKLEKLLSSDKNVNGALYDVSGSAQYATNGALFSLAQDDASLASSGEVNEYRKKNEKGKEAIYAIYQFEDGTFLLLSKERQTGLKVLQSNGWIMGVGVLSAALLIFGLITNVRSARQAKLANQVMESLDAFSEGRFERRIEMVHGEEREVQLYNAALGRLQDRVLKQTRRNNAMQMVVNRMQNGILAVDSEMKVLLVSSTAKKLLGIIGNTEGKPLHEACSNSHMEEAFAEGMGREGVYISEIAAKAISGHGHRPLRLYISPMRDEDRLLGALAMVEDITEVKHMEQVRTDFAASVSHELKTPLTVIRGFVETLSEGAINDPAQAQKFLRIITMEVERLTRLINDILTISKMESGNTEVTVSRLRLDKMAFDVADMLSNHASEKDVTVNCHMNDEPVWIIGNNDRVEQMLVNLIENAIKYNKPGGSVTVQVFSNGSEATFSVSDTGIGIPADHLPRIFERFYRVDKGRSRQMGGTGLGLAIVKHIVKSMGGEIEVQSKYGEGTEFLVTLPLAPEENGAAEETKDIRE